MEAFEALLARAAFPGPQHWVRPDYGGWSIPNLMHSLLAHFGVAGGTPLAWHADFAAALRGRRKVLFLLLDGLGWRNLEDARDIPEIDALVRDAARWPLLTVFPSTTSAATASYLSGLPPAQHGLIGFSMYFPEYGRVCNMLNFRSLGEDQTSLIDLGFAPEQFIGHPTVLARLRAAGVAAHGYVHAQYADHGLTQLTYHDAMPYPFLAPGDLAAMTLDQLRAPLPTFLFAYWSHLDTLAHTHGPRSASYRAELQMLALVIRRQILPTLDADTALVICADHGHLEGDDDQAINLAVMPALTRLFRAAPAGEGLALHLFLHPDTQAEAKARLTAIEGMTVLTRDELLRLRLLGDPPYHPTLPGRLGDLLLLPHGARRLLFEYQRRPHTAMNGRHGGLSPEQMVVPLLVY